jgi:hypothetical protein
MTKILKNAGVQLMGRSIRVFDRQTNKDIADFDMPDVDDETPDWICDAKFDSWLINVQRTVNSKGYDVTTVYAVNSDRPNSRKIIAIG